MDTYNLPPMPRGQSGGAYNLPEAPRGPDFMPGPSKGAGPSMAPPQQSPQQYVWVPQGPAGPDGSMYLRDTRTGQTGYADRYGNVSTDGGRTYNSNLGAGVNPQNLQSIMGQDVTRRQPPMGYPRQPGYPQPSPGYGGGYGGGRVQGGPYRPPGGVQGYGYGGGGQGGGQQQDFLWGGQQGGGGGQSSWEPAPMGERPPAPRDPYYKPDPSLRGGQQGGWQGRRQSFVMPQQSEDYPSIDAGIGGGGFSVQGYGGGGYGGGRQSRRSSMGDEMWVGAQERGGQRW